LAGIHLHPHDIYDEGPEQIFRYIEQMGDIRCIFPEMNTIFERNPCPKGELPHNPVHSFVHGNGRLHIPHGLLIADQNLYQKQDEMILSGKDPLFILQTHKKHADYHIVPWLNVLNGDFAGHRLEENQVIDFRGRTVPHWLCPNGPDVVPMWAKLLLETTERYGWDTYLIDRIRYPDWSGEKINPAGIFSCFCRHCRNLMAEQGLMETQLIKSMERFSQLMDDKNYDLAVSYFRVSPALQQWVRFRQESVSNLVEKLVHQIKPLNPQIRIWIDLWPPSYAWLLGQDYARLTQYANTLKHFPYHKLGGGADVQGLIEYFGKSDNEKEEVFQAFLKFFGFDFNISYEQFQQSGYPLQFIHTENKKVRTLSQPGTFIYSGIQMWNISPGELEEAILAARQSEADDVIYYCYGWAQVEHFQTVGKVNNKI